ncbi:MRP-L47-domain-containing protein [Myriangium duriaei CBS 260.36]|uniref:Large ribosomal subunit protein uL29m n=1 Tax=Myriangium duriaei CBS 260.36 TaxID=1168546 RepID=A0A9P4IWV9_9PEZI|nr:MRP-L47-domain-containing protein [Myriangium duriaei CBS 260.36]
MASISKAGSPAAQILSRPRSLPPAFLLPSFYINQSRSFHQSQSHQKRETNKQRGLSALRRTGLRKGQTLSVKLENLPKPVLDPSKRSEVEIDPDHGLWKFFNPDRTSIATPEYNNAFGRAWTVQELRQKSWEDLHKLWWVCTYERNRIATEEAERERTNAGYGEAEAHSRSEEIKLTMRAIKHTLTERWYAWQNGRAYAANANIELDERPSFPRGESYYELPSNIQKQTDKALQYAAQEGLQPGDATPESVAITPEEASGPAAPAQR